MKVLVGAVVAMVLLVAAPGAQSGQKHQDGMVEPAAAVPQVPDDAKSQYATLQVRGAGLADAMALLQKELDSVNADRARLIQRLAAAHPDFDLVPAGALAVTYVPKKTDDATKK